MKLAILAAAGLAALATQAQAATIYSQDFSFNVGGTFNGFTGGVAAVTPNSERYLELANSNAATLSVNTAGYTGLTLTFNLYGIQSLDGNGPDGGGPDNFLIYINGAANYAYSINIANYDSGVNTQSYNGNLATSGPGYAYTPFTGSTARGTLGYGSGPFGDSTYSVTFALPDAPISSIKFVGATNENASDPNGGSSGNEAYGLDNVVLTGRAVTVTPGVPEPATWGLMIVGFGLAGAALRRRKAVLAVA